jgi:hypothetical protein
MSYNMDEAWTQDDDWRDEALAEWSPALLAEVTAATTPSHTALLMRDRETLWVQAYPATRQVVLTFPPVPLPDYDQAEQVGLVREVSVGSRANLGDCFHSLVADAIGNGWQRKVHSVWSADPWAVPSMLDQPPTF